MKVPIEPSAEYLVAQAEEAQSKTASGLYIPGSAQEKSKVAVVVAVGSAVTNYKVGDKVIYQNEYEATNVKVGKEDFIIIFSKNVIAKVTA
jgi:chaperonin GroES